MSAQGASAYAAYAALQATAEVQDLYTGDCRGCGECCSRILPLSPADIIAIKGFMRTHEVTLRTYAPSPDVVDLTCPFLANDHTCAIYEARPWICRVYRCDQHKKGNLKMPDAKLGLKPYDLADLIGSV